MQPRRTPEGISGGQLANQGANIVCDTRTASAVSLFHVQNRRNPRRCHATTVFGLTICTAARQPRHARVSHAQSIRSADVKTQTSAARTIHHGELVSSDEI